ncbi:2,4-dienoyl-CoA reductase-like NADH-dependent reductase (Old Yellow Enzyme family) [Paenibacillus rhizosphaerae]|uniref:2,4-dienoyl-CoA reductase-like NADH-dependent reductase (Old Yellow Enzyme family) n=1 Tax=Paenibacillus rhizosphaerae TaxID=297318 RepID=A0A839TRC1_9BACL|nr:NADH-dependent flavin oxidoreductase [Paenibacillus rhizosphaerae]MBB3129073.1 2,4-dienoyl-CoA reductase-like NADH-dependent reductase (Old Yellow Enzyme family) [Paenibacillus rhizosphaerae]
MNPKYQLLMEPYRFKSGVEVKNRVVLAPMTISYSRHDGAISDDVIAYYESRSNGVGMAVTGSAIVTTSGKVFGGEIAADHDDQVPSLQRLAAAIKTRGAKAILQIFHGGREGLPEAVPNGEIVSASAIAKEGQNVIPRALEEQEIIEIIRAFGASTRRAIEAGFDGVEIHGANRFLIQQFFSPYTNRRDDRWGGDLDRRMAFPLAVVDEVIKVVAEHARQPFLVGYRFSPEEEMTPGITMVDTLRLVDTLAGTNLDYLHVSLMDFWSKPRSGVENHRSRMEIIDELAGQRVPVIGVGSIRTPDEALRALQSGVPLIALGRELIIDPDWVEKVAQGRENEIRTEITLHDQEKLGIADRLWHKIVHTPGWFPIAGHVEQA